MKLKVDGRPRHKNSGRPADREARGYLQWLRGRNCVFADSGSCEGRIEAAHLDFAGGKGTGLKAADRYAIPLCAGHHHNQHSRGWQTFMRTMAVTEAQLMLAAARLWNAWPSRVKWERERAA